MSPGRRGGVAALQTDLTRPPGERATGLPNAHLEGLVVVLERATAGTVADRNRAARLRDRLAAGEARLFDDVRWLDWLSQLPAG